MKNKQTSIDPEVLETIRKKMTFRHEIENDIDTLESQIRQKSQETYMDFMRIIADQAGVDMNKLLKEGLRRNKVQRRIIERGYKEITKKTKNFAKNEAKRRLDNEKKYYESIFKDILKIEGNPCLLLWEPDSAIGPSEMPHRDSPGGMFGSGCKEPHFAEHEYESEIVPSSEYSWRNHLFYPRVYVSTGDDDSHVWQRLEQNILLGRRPLVSGRGNFNVERLQVWLRGTGYCELREGHPPLFGPGSISPWSEARIGLHITLIQAYDYSPDGYTYSNILSRPYHWARYDSYSGDAYIEPYIGESRAATIYSPDEGGHEIYVYFTLESCAGAYQNEARSELDFTAPDWDGLNLHDIRVCGNYER